MRESGYIVGVWGGGWLLEKEKCVCVCVCGGGGGRLWGERVVEVYACVWGVCFVWG